MPRRGRQLVSLAALVLAALAVEGVRVPAAPAARVDCAKAGTTILANARARIYRRSGTLYGCWLPTRRARTLGIPEIDGPAEQGVRLPRLSGRYAAFEDFVCDRSGSCAAGVEVRDLKTGRDAASDLAEGRVLTLVSNSRGVAAWVHASGQRRRVFLVSRAGTRVLAEGSGIDPPSLAINAERVYWTQDDQPRSAFTD